MSDTKQKLREAFDLLEKGSYDEAVDVLKPILAEEPGNADAWWLMANTHDNPRKAREALINVLKNNPDHIQARDALNDLNDQVPPNDSELLLLMELDDAGFGVSEDVLLTDDEMFKLFEGDDSIDLDLDALDDRPKAIAEADLVDDEDLFGELLGDSPSAKSSSEPRQRRRSLLMPIMVILLAALVATLMFVLSSNEDDSSDNGGQPDVEQLVALELTENDSDLTTVVNNVTSNARQDQDFSQETIAKVASTGEDAVRTVFVETCVCLQATCEGPGVDNLSTVVLKALDLASNGVMNGGLQRDVPRIGVDVLACGTTDVVYRVYVNVEDVQQYNTTADLSEFQAAWTIE